MNIHELFEQHFADQWGLNPLFVEQSRLSNGSYSIPKMASAFRMFKAGFEANQGEKMQVLGYLTPKEIQLALTRHAVELAPYPLEGCVIGIYVKHCDALNKGSE